MPKRDTAMSYTSPVHERCPCCGSRTLGERVAYEICPICRWQDDPVQWHDQDFAPGPNRGESLNVARKRWRETAQPTFPLRLSRGDREIGVFSTPEELVERQVTLDTTADGSDGRAVDAQSRDVALTVREGSIDLLVLTEQIWEK